MKKLYIILGIVILIIATYIIINKFNDNSVSLNTFTDSNGAFSFKYPANLVVLEKEGIVAIADSKDSIKPLASISVLTYPNYLARFKDSNEVNIKPTTFNTYKTYVISYPKNPQLGIQYLVSLEDNDNPSSFLFATIIPNTNGFSQEQFDSIFKSLVIDKEKTQKLADEALTMMKAKGFEAKLKANLASVRPSAELYYELGNGYVNLCKPVANSQGEKLLKDFYGEIVKDIGQNNMACMAKKDAYAVSIKMPQGSVWCVDSTGYMNSISAMIKGYSCK